MREAILLPIICLSCPMLVDVDEKSSTRVMSKGYDQAVQGDSYPIDDVFEELER